jgi:hypothetical protein
VPKQDALEVALKGTGLASGESAELDPFGPGWRTPKEHERVRLAAAIIRDYEEGILDPGDVGAYSREGQVVTLPDGERLLIHDLIDAQRRTAYELLQQKVDPKAIGAVLLRPESWVKALQEEFQIF